jgi:hypothetical protein
MAKLVPATCPNCGAGVDIERDAASVKCAFCGTSSFIQWAGKSKPPPPSPNEPAMPVIDMPSQSAGAGAAALVLGAALAVIVAIGYGIHWLTRPADTELEQAVEAPDLGAVDAAMLIQQAVQLAKKKNPRAKLVAAQFVSVKGGTLDLAGGATGSVRFEFHYSDPSEPPGNDIVNGSFFVMIKGDALRTRRTTSGASTLSNERLADAYPIAVPDCKSKRAFAVAVESGTPKNAVTTLHLMKTSAAVPDADFQWSFRVAGHQEHMRDIHTETCEMVRDWSEER